MQINDVILEIKNLKNSSVHKSALDIFRLLETNKTLFVDKMDSDNFSHLLKEIKVDDYISDGEKHYMFWVDCRKKKIMERLREEINKVLYGQEKQTMEEAYDGGY
jgi:hypothetical protein